MWKKVLLGVLVVIVAIVVYGYFLIRPMFSVSVGTKIEDYQNPQKALLVIDIQKDMTAPGGKAIINLQQTDPMIANVNSIIEQADSLGLIVVYICHEFEPNALIEFVTRGALKHGSEGAEIDSRIAIINDHIFVKHKGDGFSNPDLDKFLIENQVNHLYFTGLDAEACVDKTLKAAFNRGYKLTVISDGIATATEERRDKKIMDFKTMGAEILTTEELLHNIQ